MLFVNTIKFQVILKKKNKYKNQNLDLPLIYCSDKLKHQFSYFTHINIFLYKIIR